MDTSRHIVIIGGGAAGLTAAHYLREGGYDRVTVLEAGERLGGKCYTLEVDGLFHEMGAVLISPAYTETLKLVERFGTELIPAVQMWAIDPMTGQSRAMPGLDDAEADGLTEEDVKTIGLTYLTELRKHKKHVGKAGYINLPPEICEPFAPWAKARGLDFLVDLFRVPLTCFGYGALDETPAAYVMKNMSRKSFLYVTNNADGWPRIFKRGYQDLMEKIGESLPDVRLGARVTQVKRGLGGGDGAEITYTQGGETKTLKADALILAVPLDGEGGLDFIDLSAEETRLFSQVRYYNYATVAARVPGLPPGLGYCPVLKGDRFVEPPETEPCLYVRHFEGSDCGIFYANGKEGDGPAEIEAGLVRAMERLGHEVTEILDTRLWRYFPHVGTAEMAAGFFDDVEALQGVAGTYYTGGQLDFDIVEGAVSFSRSLVDRHFLK